MTRAKSASAPPRGGDNANEDSDEPPPLSTRFTARPRAGRNVCDSDSVSTSTFSDSDLPHLMNRARPSTSSDESSLDSSIPPLLGGGQYSSTDDSSDDAPDDSDSIPSLLNREESSSSNDEDDGSNDDEFASDSSDDDSEYSGSVDPIPLPPMVGGHQDSSFADDSERTPGLPPFTVGAETAAAPPTRKTNRRRYRDRKKKKSSREAEIDPSVKEIIEAISANSGRSSIDRLESYRDNNGHTILQIATEAQNVDVLDWLVKKKGVDPELQDNHGKTAFDFAEKNNLSEMQRKLTGLRQWSLRKKKQEEDRLRKLRSEMSIKLQSVARGFLARKELERLREAFTCEALKKVVYEVMDLEISRKRIPPGKSWTYLKRELDLVVENELDAIGVAALQLEANEEEDLEYEGDLEEVEVVTESCQAAPSQEKQREVHSIQLTAEVLRWIRQQKDEKYREMFAKRVAQLARGDRSYCLSKPLKGSKRLVTETKLDKGQRIIWTQRGNEILVWFVCKHKHISRCLELVDLSYERVLTRGDNSVEIPEYGGRANGIAQGDIMNEDKEPEMLVNPSSNVPLRIHSLRTSEIEKFVQDSTWKPPLKLTAQEEDIVNKDGTVLLLGRSGTGKTLCVVSRIARDTEHLRPDARQLFMARTQRLCNFVSDLVRDAAKGEGNVEFKKVSAWIEELRTQYADGDDDRWHTKHIIDYRRFYKNIWDLIRGDEKKLDALQVWTQIRSFIKGSFEAARQHRPLEESQYVNDLSKDRCRLDTDTRQRAYRIFQRYQRILDENGWWDDMDRTAEVVRILENNASLHEEPLYDRIYVDEVQDVTQAEIGLFFLVSGNRPDSLFLAGDPAQAVSQGVDFRFEEVRSVVHMISDGKRKVERWQKLVHNFRSHEGILKVANLVLDRLHCAFPSAALKLPRDKGLVLGPRPALIEASFDDLARLLQANQRIRVLVREDYKKEYNDEVTTRVPGAPAGCFGIVEAKGLEFSEVLIVDFFKSLSDAGLKKAWKQLLLDALPANTSTVGRNIPSPAILSLPQAMELELKLLYTAITRTKDRLLFIETSPSPGFKAWCRCLQSNGLAEKMQTDDVIKEGTKLMTKDDWRVEGIEMALLAESDDGKTLSLLERSISYFQKAGDADLEARARAQLKAMKLEDAANQEILHKSTSEAMVDGCKAVLAYLDAGMTQEAARVCNDLCSSTGLTGLGGRIEKLASLSNN